MDVTVIAVSFSVLLWLYLSSVILTAYVASEKGRSGVGWFFLSFLEHFFAFLRLFLG